MGPEYTVHDPPSNRYTISETPPSRSEAFSVTDTDEMYQPFAPTVPETEAVVTGAIVLMRIVVVCVGSTSPAASVAEYSRVYSPSVRTKGPSYTSHEPLSSRYEICATPLVASEALRESVTFDRYHRLSPNDPCSTAELTGVVVSTRTLTDRSSSLFPARSVARNPRTCRPSPSVTAPA